MNWILVAVILLSSILGSFAHQHHHYQPQIVMAGPAHKASLNVFKSPLAFFSNQPITGYLRNGYCEVPPGDFGNHSVAAEVTEEFLDYTEKQGNDLRIAGLRGGCKWCLCASRWREAFEARKSDNDPMVPKVFLNATNEKALNTVTLDELKKFSKE